MIKWLIKVEKRGEFSLKWVKSGKWIQRVDLMERRISFRPLILEIGWRTLLQRKNSWCENGGRMDNIWSSYSELQETYKLIALSFLFFRWSSMDLWKKYIYIFQICFHGSGCVSHLLEFSFRKRRGRSVSMIHKKKQKLRGYHMDTDAFRKNRLYLFLSIRF